MEKIKNMTKENVEIIHRNMVWKLNRLADELGLSFELGSAKYNTLDGTFKCSLTLTCESDDGMPTSFPRDAASVGLHESDFGRVFNVRGKSYEIVNIKPRNRKYPVIARELRNGKTYKFPAHTVSYLLNKEE